MSSQVSRRNFVRVAAGATALSQAAQGANDRARVGFIGVGSRGFGGHVRKVALLKEFGAKVDLVAVSDVYSGHRDLRLVQYKMSLKGGVIPTQDEPGGNLGKVD